MGEFEQSERLGVEEAGVRFQWVVREGLTKNVTSEQDLKDIKGQNLNPTLITFQEFARPVYRRP